MAPVTGFPVVVVVVSLLAGLVVAGRLPDNIKRCARSDPELFECLRDAVEDALPRLKSGMPKLGLAQLDPLLVQELRITQGDGPISADLVFTNMVTTGLLDDTKVYKAEINFDNLTIDASFRFHRAVATSNYTIKGRVLVLPISGAGGSKVVLHDSTCSWHMRGQRITKKDKKEYLDLTHVEIKMTPKRMEMQFDNLFGGEQQLGKAMNRVLNDNWQLVYNEIGSSFEKGYSEVVKQHARSLFLHVPLEDIFPEKL